MRDNILIPFYLDHRTPDEQMLRKLTEILGIAEKLDSRPSQISGTQTKKSIKSNDSTLFYCPVILHITVHPL